MAAQEAYDTRRVVRGVGPVGAVGRVRLRTLVLIRWIALGGQAAALLFVYGGLGFPLPLGPAFVAVTISALLNVVVSIRYPPTKRLSDREAAFSLAYDILQLGALLYLTGGLINPFAILLLVPVTISATILSLRSTIGLGCLAMACMTVLALWHLPLPWSGGGLELGPVYTLGVWVALLLATVFLSAYAWRVAEEARRMTEALAETQTALGREQRLAALGGLAAAAAHELATPLSTISVVAKEIARDLPDHSPLAEDVSLLRSQATRCRDILRRLSAQPDEGRAAHFSQLPLAVLVETAAAPYRNGTKEIVIESPDGPQPLVQRRAELVQGLGNLIENAVDFARASVSLSLSWDDREIGVEVSDDGPGFSPTVLGLLGEPYVSTRRDEDGMGLGVFIARTLLERTGAVVEFGNRRDGGASVVITWPREVLEVHATEPPGRPPAAAQGR